LTNLLNYFINRGSR